MSSKYRFRNINGGGAAGPPGPPGPAGPQGNDGPQGSTGTQGSPGAPGLTGPTGAAGVTGAAGATGTSGASGATGATGVTGTRGLMGYDGNSDLWRIIGPSAPLTPVPNQTFSLDEITYANVNAMNISQYNINSDDFEAWIYNIEAGDIIWIRRYNDTADQVRDVAYYSVQSKTPNNMGTFTIYLNYTSMVLFQRILQVRNI